jgi:hypothetical protein
MTEFAKDKREVKGCYKTTNAKTGKHYLRKRPAIQATVCESTLDMLKDLEVESGLTFASVVEKCVLFGVTQFRKSYVADKKVAPIAQPKSNDMNNEERFMRKKIFDFDNKNQDWQPTSY